MGLKRPFDAEEMQECNAKHAKQLTYSPKKLNQLDEAILDKTCVLEDLSGLSEKDFDTCAPPFSWISTGLCQEDALSQSSLFHHSSGSDFTWRPISPVEDVYSCLMNHAPRKQVPVGSNHQADIPECLKEEILDLNHGDFEGKPMGKCITPMPDSDVRGTGQGRKECLCLDEGSIGCVRHHIVEARKSLIETIGYERFMELGLCAMGEEVASLWTEDEEDIFHKVVYSNPVSLGRNFWKQLKTAFPSRTTEELVNYYFNVFILRRRARQNRFKTLDVDSDDDEWRVEYNVFCRDKSVDEEDNNGTHEDNEDEQEEESNRNDDEDDDDEEQEESPINDVKCVYMDSRDGKVNVEDDSCMSFELQDSNLIFSNSPIEKRECHKSNDDSYSFGDRRHTSDCWNKNNELLPTSNIIEEIFGQDEW